MLLQMNLDVHAVLGDIERERNAFVAEGLARRALHAPRAKAANRSAVVVKRQHLFSRLWRGWPVPFGGSALRGAPGTTGR